MKQYSLTFCMELDFVYSQKQNSNQTFPKCIEFIFKTVLQNTNRTNNIYKQNVAQHLWLQNHNFYCTNMIHDQT